MLLRLLCCVLLLWLSRDHVTSLDLEPGISEALAADRARRVSDVRYALSFVIPELKGQPIEGRLLSGLGPLDIELGLLGAGDPR